jgi:hypothetical protein
MRSIGGATPIQASRTVIVSGSPREVLEMVLDLDAYRVVDPKVREVVRPLRLDDAGRGTVEVVGSLWHLPPVAHTHLVHLERWHRLTFASAPNERARAAPAFTATFEVSEGDQGTRVRHAYEITLRRPLPALVGQAVQRWLDADLADEMVRLQGRLAVG